MSARSLGRLAGHAVGLALVLFGLALVLLACGALWRAVEWAFGA